MAWAEIEAYFVALGFEVRHERIGSMMRRCQPVISRVCFSRQYVQRSGAPFRTTWRAKFQDPYGKVTWSSPRFDDPISAYVNAEIENWGRP